MRSASVTMPVKILALSFLFQMLLLVFASGQVHAAPIQLCTLLSPGGTINLNPASSYQLASECDITRTVTINGNGVTITGGGSLFAWGSGVTLTINSLSLTSSQWAALAARTGSNLVVQNSSISCPGGSGIYADLGSSATVRSTTIDASTYYGVKIAANSTGSLHAVTIYSRWAVEANGAGASVTVDEGSFLKYIGPGTGVGILNGASGVVRDSTVWGFTNGIDIQSGSTAAVQNCLLQDNGCSGFGAVDSNNVLLSNSTVVGSVQDGVFFLRSTGTIDRSQILQNGMTGVSFSGCSNGATIQNSLLKDNGDQGVAINSADLTPLTPPSLNINVLDNTFVGNHVANLLVYSPPQTAHIQGNIFTQAPGSDIHFHGPKDITLDSALVTNTYRGMEVENGSSTRVVLSDISSNSINGILIYGNSSLIGEQSIFWGNGVNAQGGTAGDQWSIFVTDGSAVQARSCTFGPAGNWGFYSYSAAACDVSANYWSAADGPTVASWLLPQGAINGSGAHLEAGYQFAGPVTYIPYLTQSPVSSNVNDGVGLASGGGLAWDSQLGLTIGLTANQGSAQLSNEILGVLKVNDTENMTLVTPPDYLLQGQLYVVWISVSLRFNSASGFLQFSLPSQNRPVDLKRRGAGGSWTQVASVWDQSSHTLTYSPTDPHQLNGTFAITETPDAVYVKCDGLCSGNAPCYISVQDGAGSIVTDTVMYATNETFSGNVTYDVPAALNLSGGWDATYSTDHAYTHIQGSLTITGGELIAGNVVVE
jgi:Right handed beta helix region